MIDAQTQTYIFAAIVIAALALLTYAFKQRGSDIKTVADTVPLEFAQFAFRLAMERANTTPDALDNEAVLRAARELGYTVTETSDGSVVISKGSFTAQGLQQRSDTER